MKNIPLTPQERQIIEEAFLPYIQAVTIIAKLRGLNPGTAQLAADRASFVVQEEAPARDPLPMDSGSNGISSLTSHPNYGD